MKAYVRLYNNQRRWRNTYEQPTAHPRPRPSSASQPFRPRARGTAPPEGRTARGLTGWSRSARTSKSSGPPSSASSRSTPTSQRVVSEPRRLRGQDLPYRDQMETSRHYFWGMVAGMGSPSCWAFTSRSAHAGGLVPAPAHGLHRRRRRDRRLRQRHPARPARRERGRPHASRDSASPSSSSG